MGSRFTQSRMMEGRLTAALQSAAGTIPDPVELIDHSLAFIHINKDSPITGTPTDVSAVTAGGTANTTLSSDVASPSGISQTDDGFVFSDSGYLRTTPNLPATDYDGWFGVVACTPDSYGSNLGVPLEMTSGSLGLMRHNSNNWQFVFNFGGSNTTITDVPVVYGTKVILGVAYDPRTGTVKYRSPDGQIHSVNEVSTATLFRQIRFGRFMVGTVHEIAIYARDSNGDFLQTFEDVVADFETKHATVRASEF